MTEIFHEGMFGPDPKTVPLRVNFQGEPIGEATVYPDGTTRLRIFGDPGLPCAHPFAYYCPASGENECPGCGGGDL